MSLFDFLKRPQEDVHIFLPGVEIAWNHRLKICFIYEMDSSMPQDRYSELEKHLNKRGYFMQVIVASAGMPIPVMSAYPNLDTIKS